MSPYTALQSGLRAVIIATQPGAIDVRAARFALTEAGMRTVEVLQPGQRAAEGGATVVVSVLDDSAASLDAAWCEELLTSPYGGECLRRATRPSLLTTYAGVVVEYRTQAAELLDAAQHTAEHVWTTVSARELAEQGARERFFLFTGRRAPPLRPAHLQ